MANKFFKEEKNKKKKKRKDNDYLEDGLKFGIGMIGLGIGLKVLKEI